MGRSPCCSKVGLNRGPWTSEEDTCLAKYIETHGEGSWRAVPKLAGLLRCGKSCRLRWVNYLRPSVRRGNISEDEENLIIKLHSLLGNRWSLIAGRIPGRTDNEIKNYWNTHLSKKLKKMGVDPKTHKPVNMSQKTHYQARADLSNENRPSPSVLHSQGNSVSACLEETSKHQNDSVRFSLTCNKLVQDSSLKSKGSCSAEINSSNTFKIHPSEMVICGPTSPTSDHLCHLIMDQDLSISMNSELQGKGAHLRPVSSVISTTGDSFTSNCSSPSSVMYPADFSSPILNCDISLSSTNCKDQLDQLIISSEPTSALIIEYDKEQALDQTLDQTRLMQAFDFLPVDFTDYDTNVSSPASSGIFPQHITNHNVMKNDSTLFFDMERLNAAMDLADVDQINFSEEPGVSVGELISESINKQQAEEYSELTMSSTRTDLWDGFGEIISSSDYKSPQNSLIVESCIFSFHYNCDLELDQTSRPPTILPQHRDEYDDNWYFESCSDFHGDNSVYSYELY